MLAKDSNDTSKKGELPLLYHFHCDITHGRMHGAKQPCAKFLLIGVCHSEHVPIQDLEDLHTGVRRPKDPQENADATHDPYNEI